MKYLVSLLFALTITLIACDEQSVDNTSNDLPDVDLSEQGDIDDYINTSLEYGLGMFQDVNEAEDEENVLISPYSLQSALYMTMTGARGETFQEFSTALNTGDFLPNGLGTYYHDINDQLIPRNENTIFNNQNKIYYYPSLYTPSEEYENDIQTYYNGTFAEEDFSDPATVDVINDWVDEVTEGRIEKVLDMIQPDEAMFLINALVFTADWGIGFPEYGTFDRPFTTDDGNQIDVPTMSSDDVRPYLVTDEYSAVDLPVKDEDYAVTFILPSEASDISEFISGFDPEIYNNIYDNLQSDRVQVYLPKFELATSMNMKDVLVSRGMTSTFENADLSGMGQFAGSQYLTRVLHDVYVKVDEKGIDGAAVTTVGVGVESVPPTLTFDRPFVFVVRHIDTRVPIFIGKVGNPVE
jgi:serpin B